MASVYNIAVPSTLNFNAPLGGDRWINFLSFLNQHAIQVFQLNKMPFMLKTENSFLIKVHFALTTEIRESPKDDEGPLKILSFLSLQIVHRIEKK